jgi:signal transduction histidine kinase
MNDELPLFLGELPLPNEETNSGDVPLANQVEELERAHKDIAGLLRSAGLPMLLLDVDLRIRRFTEATTRLLHVLETDVGRPVGEVARKFRDADLLDHAEGALSALAPFESEVQADDGSWWARRALPHLARDSQVEGVVVTFNEVTALKRREEDLQRTLLDLATEERRRVGQELHDSVGQELTALGLVAQNLVGAFPDVESAEGKIVSRIARGVDGVLAQVQALARGLLPVEVQADGVPAALADLAARTCEHARVTCTCHCEGPIRLDSAELATHLFRIAQEAVANALKHGQAQHVRITLTDGEAVTLRVEDDGIGLGAAPAASKGMGLKIMQYRANLMGATFRVEPAGPVGTVVICSLPRSATHGRQSAGAC